MQRCQRCIMPTVPGMIELDDQGVCGQCRNHQPFRLKGERELLKLLDSHRSTKKRYDCIVTVSGGRDSAFTLLKLSTDYNLRVLAVNYENPFSDDQAKANIENMVKKLNVKLIRFHLKRQIHERMLKNNLLAWLRRPSPAMVPVICIGCKIIWPEIIKIAREHGVRCIVNGGNPYEYTSFKKEFLGVNQKAGLVTTYFLNIFCLAREALHNLAYIRPQYLPETLRAYLFANQYALGSQLLGSKLDKIDLFHYVQWDEKEVLTRIQNELDWRSPPDLDSTWRFDCKLSHLKDLMYLTSLGITEKDDFYSKLVREDKLSRDEALNRVKRENEIPFEIIEDVFHRLGIPENTLRN
ncbi:ATPase [Candidatus Zixiibacteriota bacterium]